MVLRRSGGDLPLVSLAILLAIVVVGAEWFAHSIAPAIFFVGLIAATVGISFSRSQLRARRLGRLREKYHDDTLVQRILSGQYWQGQTDEQLRDALGQPRRVEDQMLYTRHRQLWSYRSPEIDITLDDGVVVAWASKE
ncbi:MAG TPA: hypothetical protein VG714_03200 [Acidobacteriaceae bacterium]|nr:hypothetical protein [Acidobacteriaceae bacterium]